LVKFVPASIKFFSVSSTFAPHNLLSNSLGTVHTSSRQPQGALTAPIADTRLFPLLCKFSFCLSLFAAACLTGLLCRNNTEPGAVDTQTFCHALALGL
jgi:hypothetical protein